MTNRIPQLLPAHAEGVAGGDTLVQQNSTPTRDMLMDDPPDPVVANLAAAERMVIHDIEDIQYKSYSKQVALPAELEPSYWTEGMTIHTTQEDFDKLFETPAEWDEPVQFPVPNDGALQVTDTPMGELPVEVKIVQITGKGKRAAGHPLYQKPQTEPESFPQESTDRLLHH